MTSYISVDLETTGLSYANNEIIEIGAWKLKDGVVVEKFCVLVKPVVCISREIQRITGISNDMVCDALSIEEVLPDFFAFCEDLPFLGHNLQFDYSFLCYRGKKMGLDFTLAGTRCGIDTLKLSRQFLKGTISNKLEDIAKYFKIELDSKRGGFHRASYDAYITKLVYDRFYYVYPNLAGVKLPEILNKDDNTKYGKVVCDDTLSFD